MFPLAVSILEEDWIVKVEQKEDETNFSFGSPTCSFTVVTKTLVLLGLISYHTLLKSGDFDRVINYDNKTYARNT